MREWLHYKNQLDRELFDYVDWNAIRNAGEGFAALYQLWVTKFVSGHSAVGRMMKLWGYQEDDNCPCCQLPQETTRHLLECTDPRLHCLEGSRRYMIGDPVGYP